MPAEWPALFLVVQSGRLKPERYISHVVPLSAGAAAYPSFDAGIGWHLKTVLMA